MLALIVVCVWKQVGEEVLGTAAKIEVTKENCTIVGDGSSEEAVKSRVKQIKNIVANTDQDYEKEKLNERIARLSGGVAIIQVPSSATPLMSPCLHPLCITASVSLASVSLHLQRCICITASSSLPSGSNARLDMQCAV